MSDLKAEGGRRGGGGQDPLEALQRALDVVPSPEFLARVRDRVRNEPIRSPFWWWPRLVLTSGVGLAIVIAAVLWSGQGGPSTVGLPNGVRRAASGQAALTPQASDTVRVPPVAARSVGPVSGGTAQERPHRGQSGPGPAARRLLAAADSFAVLVPGDERRALDRLLLAVRQGKASVPAPAPDRVMTDAEGNLLDPPPIDIPPLKPIQPLPMTEALDRTGSDEK